MMKSNQLLTEISRIQEMMGIVNENKMLLKESIGDEIAEILAKFLKKDVTELTSLGVRNADDLKKLMDDFLDPAVSAANKVDLLKLIVDDLGDVALKSIAKNAIDDVTTGVGKELSNKVTQYLDWYKQGIMTYDQVLKQTTDDLTLAMSKSSDELVSLKNAINDEALLKVKGQLDNAKSVLDSELDAAAKTARDLQMQLDMSKKLSDQFDSVKLQIEALPSFKILDTNEQIAVRNFLESNKDKTPTILLNETEAFISKLLLDPSRVKQIPLEDRKFLQRITLLLQNPKKLILYIGSGTILVITALILTGNIGSARRLYNKNEQDWENADPDNQGGSITSCNQTLENFKTYLTSTGYSQKTIDSATFDTNTCTGTVTLGDGSQEPLKWNGTTFI